MGITLCNETLQRHKEGYTKKYKGNEYSLSPVNIQYIGKRREQQDSFGFSDAGKYSSQSNTGVIAVVADGMGGMSLGKEVSQFSVKSMIENYLTKSEDEKVEDALSRALNYTNKGVVELGRRNHQEGNVGTTLVAMAIVKGELHWISVGDSHLYLIRDNKVICLTSEHVYGKELFKQVESGEIDMEEAMEHPERASLTSYVGLEFLEEIDASRSPIPIAEKDKILLCSDGFYNSLNEREILEAMERSEESMLETLCNKIINKDVPYQDNATAIMLCVNCK